MEEEIKKIIKENLSIELNQITEFGPCETIEVELYFDNELIDEASCTLPEKG